jgi:GNAT superfamily N-acetyltransferase
VPIERIAALPEGFAELEADARADGQKMLSVLREDWESGAIRFDAPGEALFAASRGNALAGIAGLTRDPYLTAEEAGRVRRLYVRRSARRYGVGRALVAAIIAAAEGGPWERLRVRAPAEAFAFYDACGFMRCVEKAATHVRQLSPSPAHGREREGPARSAGA